MAHQSKSESRVKTILVVDDELANAEVLALLLKDEGYQVFCAANGRDGLERVAEVHPDLVLLDYMMPIMNGELMGKALRADLKTRHIRIVLNSALAEWAVRERFVDYDAFLRKPYDIEKALELFAKLLQE